MQKFYLSVSRNNEISPAERSTIRDALVDYGALHHFPASQVRNSPARETSNNISSSRLRSTVSDKSNLSWETTPSNQSRAPGQITLNFTQHEPFEFLRTNIGDTSSDEEVVNAFQIFWTTFPGQVGSNPYA
ncbi:hypothetical protein VTN77DRAFT_1439 [Rasamsonia byssochlamydoides]|uniref:uncharacterized protein n=1 Tax=Rasamsonia byssochlamydoides TaxID=89139 RepID=UPI0037440BBE